MDSEKWQRIQKKELIGKNLEAEDLPLEHKQRKDNKNMTIIKKTACGYLERESHIIHRGSFKVKSYLLLYKLSVRIFSWVMASIIPEIIVCILRFRTGQLTCHGGQIPENCLFLKIGDDHGQGSTKFEFRLANVLKPNSSKKTVVFAIFHAKDTRNNRRAVTSNYKKQLKDLLSTTWQ